MNNKTDIAVRNPFDSSYYQTDITGSNWFQPDIKLTPEHRCGGQRFVSSVKFRLLNQRFQVGLEGVYVEITEI